MDRGVTLPMLKEWHKRGAIVEVNLQQQADGHYLVRIKLHNGLWLVLKNTVYPHNERVYKSIDSAMGLLRSLGDVHYPVWIHTFEKRNKNVRNN